MNPIPSLLAAAALAVGATAVTAADSKVEVSFSDPGKFSDLRASRLATERDSLALADELRRHLEREAPRRLPPGTQLSVKITDVDMAGEFWPVAASPVMSDFRVVKDLFPPRVDLDFRLSQADGSLVREGHRELRDPLFLSSVSRAGTDLLRFEKALLDGWLRREFAAPR